MDLAVATAEALKDRTELIKSVIINEPPNSILCLCSVESGKFDNEITQVLKEFVKHNEPYIKVTAVVGVEGLKQIIFNGVLLFTKRKNLVLKGSKQEALDWLVEQ